MKTVAMILIMLVSTSVGVYFSVRLKKRGDEWQKLSGDFSSLYYEIEQRKSPILTSLGRIPCKSRLFQYLESAQTDDVAKSYADWKVREKPSDCLEKEDYELMDPFFAEIGRYDYGRQVVLLKEYAEKSENKRLEVMERVRQYGKLRAVGGLMAGLFAVIVIW